MHGAFFFLKLMPKPAAAEIEALVDLVDRYNNCFYDRDIEALREMYVSDGEVIFFDNHASCDTDSLAEHLESVAKFFSSGEIVELTKENIRIHRFDKSACITLTLRYSNNPKPGIRTTLVCEMESGQWKIRHVHHSRDPNES